MEKQLGLNGKDQIEEYGMEPFIEQCKESVEHMAHDEQNGKPASSVAKVFLKLAGKKNPKIRCAVGLDYKALAFLAKILPARLINFIIRLIYIS